MVVLAEQAHEDGLCWPGIPRLARRVNTSERNIQLLIRELKELGELLVDLGTGRGHTNEYRVLPLATAERLIPELSARLERVKNSDERVKLSALLERVKSSAERVKVSAQRVKSPAKRVKPSTPEPTANQQRTNTEPTAPAAGAGKTPAAAGQGEAGNSAQQGSAGGADAPHGADGASSQTVTDQTGFPTRSAGQVPASEKIPPAAGAALAALTGALAGLKRPVAELIAEYPDRAGWLELAPDRIRALLAEARQANGARFRGALIDALDEEVRRMRAPVPTFHTTDDEIDMAALIDGAPLEGNRRRA